MFAYVNSLFRNLLQKQGKEQDLDREINSHLELLTDEKIRGGMNPRDAAREARIELGGAEQVKVRVRAVRAGVWLETLWQDVNFGVRVLRKSSGFTAVAILTLALGIGATTAIFTVTYATLLAPLPYPQPDRLVAVGSKLQGHRTFVSAVDFSDWRRQSTAFEDLNAIGGGDFDIVTQGHPESITGMQVTPGYFRMLGNPLFLGRSFLPEEGKTGKDHVAILTYRLWRHLGADPQILDRTMQINGEPYTVVGVLAQGIDDRRVEQLILPLVFRPEELSNHNHEDGYFVLGRLKPGVTILQAQAQMDAITAQEAKEYPKSNQGWGAIVEPLKNGELPGETRLTLWLLLGAVAFLLLIACLNIANLLLAKGISRQREAALRGALGARPTAIFAQFLTESLLLAVLGGALGVAIGYAMLHALIVAMPPNALPAEADLRLNVPILLTMLTATTLAGVVFGSAPAWYASRSDPTRLLNEGGRAGIGKGRQRLRRALVVAEFAVALPLLAGAGLAIHSFWNLTHVDLGVRTDHIFGFYLIPAPLVNDRAQVIPYYRRILAGIEAIPGVSRAAAATYLPLEHLNITETFTVAGQPDYAIPSLRPNADFVTVTPSYFQTFGVQIVKGRTFTDADNESGPRVAMVNETFVSRFLKGLDPLRQRLMMKAIYPENGPAIDWQIVGVFHTVKSRGSREDNPEIYAPFWQEAYPYSAIGVRTLEDPAIMVKSIAAAVSAVDPPTPLYLARTMEQVHDEGLANDRFTMILFVSFAVVALLLAAVGIYGVMAFSVTQRAHEIALRISLGATRSHVVALTMKEGMALACLGLGLGLIGAYIVGRGMQSALFGVPAIDFSAIGAVGFVLLLVALLACYLPAQRATRVDPMMALRHE